MSDTRSSPPGDPLEPSFVEEARKRRYREFVAQHWRPVPAPPQGEKPSFWATSWEDARRLRK